MRQPPGRFAAVRSLIARRYDVVRAIDDVSFAVDEGEAVAYVGPNGAGKSTTIKILTGILVPTGGVVKVAGIIPWRSRTRNALQVGVVLGQRTQLWWDLPLYESFQLMATLYRVPPQRYRLNLERLSALLDLDEFIGTPVRQLSLGQRMRGELTAALIHEPSILYLDEPTIGLDLFAKEKVRTFIEELNRDNGTTILLTTHDLSDVERLCKRIIIIDGGHLLFDGPIVELKARYAPWRLLGLQIAQHQSASGSDFAISGGELSGRSDGKLWWRFDPSRVSVADLVAQVTSRFAVEDIALVEPNLEMVIKAIYEDRRR